MEEILKVEDLSIIYKTDLETVYAVNGISFSLKQGETMGLVGETGCRKNNHSHGNHGTSAEKNRQDYFRPDPL